MAVLVCDHANVRGRNQTVQKKVLAALRECQNGRIGLSQKKKARAKRAFYKTFTRFRSVRHRLHDVVYDLFRIAEEHHRIVAEEQLILDASIA